MTDQRILSAGGGPVGMLCAWLLGRRGIAVRLFDNNREPQADPRAATTHPATLDLLSEDGLDEEMARVGLVAPIFQFWDRPSQQLVAQFDHAVLKNDTRHPFVVQCEQFKTVKLILDRLQRLANVEVLFDHDVIDLAQSAHAVTVQVREPSERRLSDRRRRRAQHGAAPLCNTIRRLHLAGTFYRTHHAVRFRGRARLLLPQLFRRPRRLVQLLQGLRRRPAGLWRTVYPTDPAHSAQDILSDAGVQARMQSFFTSPRPYEIIHRNLYVTHQRVAETFRKGRVLLAGDAAHVNNPIGGMGLNGGIQDAVNLAGKLAGILLGGESDRSLDLYNLQRRTVATEFVQEQSIANKRRLEESDPGTRARNLAELTRIAQDPERARQF